MQAAEDSWQTEDDVTMPLYGLEPQYVHLQSLNLHIWAPPGLGAKARTRRRRRRASREARQCKSLGATEDLPPATEEEWRRRISKRREGLASVKTEKYYSNYQLNAKLSGDRGIARPISPDPEDRTLSKRKWEKQACRWRNRYRLADMQAHVRAHCPEADEASVEAACLTATSALHSKKERPGYFVPLPHETHQQHLSRLHEERKAHALALVGERWKVQKPVTEEGPAPSPCSLS